MMPDLFGPFNLYGTAWHLLELFWCFLVVAGIFSNDGQWTLSTISRCCKWHIGQTAQNYKVHLKAVCNASLFACVRCQLLGTFWYFQLFASLLSEIIASGPFLLGNPRFAKAAGFHLKLGTNQMPFPLIGHQGLCNTWCGKPFITLWTFIPARKTRDSPSWARTHGATCNYPLISTPRPPSILPKVF